MLGAYTSIRRGQGSDVAGSRPYRPGDHARTIDWKASARLSSVTRRRRVHRARALRARDATSRDRLRPPARDGAISSRSSLGSRSLWRSSGSSSCSWSARSTSAAWSATSTTQATTAENDAGTPFWRPPRAHGGSWGEGNLVEQLETAPAWRPRRAIGHARPGPPVPLRRRRGRPDRKLRLRRLRLPGTAASARAGPRRSTEAGTRRGRRPGSRLGAELPAHRRRRDAVRRGRRRRAPICAADGSRGRPRGGRSTIERLARLERDLLELGVDPILVSSEQPEAVQSAFLEWAEHRLTARGLLVTPAARPALAVAAFVAVAAAAVAVVFWVAPRWDAGEGGTFGVRSLVVSDEHRPARRTRGRPRLGACARRSSTRTRSTRRRCGSPPASLPSGSSGPGAWCTRTSVTPPRWRSSLLAPVRHGRLPARDGARRRREDPGASDPVPSRDADGADAGRRGDTGLVQLAAGQPSFAARPGDDRPSRDEARGVSHGRTCRTSPRLRRSAGAPLASRLRCSWQEGGSSRK